jgi:Domain of unknown function (DUF4157)
VIAAARPSQVPVTQPDDPAEREAEQLAGKIMPRPPARGRPLRSPFAYAPSVVWDALATPSLPLAAHELDAAAGADPSDVQIHEGTKAAESARALNTAAYTVGNHIVLSAAYSRLQGREAGTRLLAHELAHVTQQARTPARPVLVQRLPVPPKSDDPFDPFKKVLEEEERAARRRTPPPPPPVPVTPGDPAEQFRLFDVSGTELWERPDVKSTMESLAEQVEAHEAKARPGKVTHTKIAMLNYWDERFTLSVEYILAKRDTTPDPTLAKHPSVPAQKATLHELQREEAKLAASFTGEALIAQVTTLRATFRNKWEGKVDHAVKRFLQLAQSEAEFIAGEEHFPPPFVIGLPAGLEKMVTPAQAPGQVEKTSKPVTESVVHLMKKVQELSGDAAVAENYGGHAKANPHVSDSSIGEYSFDVHPKKPHFNPDTGFYDRDEVIKYFEAVERASQDLKIEWLAYYNDIEVIKRFNKAVGKGRIGFSGGGGHGTYHHGPEPYILHIHFNIMPKDLADKFFTTRDLLDRAHKIFEAFLADAGALF